MSKCEVCGLGPPEDVIAVYRQNPKGQKGVWRCERHNQAPIDPDVREIVQIIEKDNAR